MNIEEVTFITKNKRKLYRAKEAFKKEGIKIKHLDIETTEVQGTNNEQVVTQCLKELGSRLKRFLVLEDVGFYIPSINGFPGPYIKYINKWFNPKHYLLLMDNQKNRSCYKESCLGLYLPSQDKVVVFSAKEFGEISYIARGSSPYPLDNVFIPEGYHKTRGELTEKEILQITNFKNWEDLIKYIKENV
jgi:XTP/dITP diphosphohydrolase